MKKCFSLLLLVCTIQLSTLAQNIGINATGALPNPSAILDVSSSNKGILIPRVALTASNVAAPLTAPVASLLIYNTATAGTVHDNVIPGYYYWTGAQWTRLINGGTGINDQWNLLGNGGTVDGTHFIGTTDNVPLIFKMNNL